MFENIFSGTSGIFIILILFILFVFSIKKISKILTNIVWIGAASVLFPIFMNKVLGFNIPVGANSILSFLFLGLGLYLVYILAKCVYTVLGIFEKSVKPVTGSIKDLMKGKKDKKIDEHIKKEEKRHKEEEERLKEIEMKRKKEEKLKKHDEEDDYVEIREE